LRGDTENGWKDCDRAVEREPGYVAGFQCRGFIHWYQGRLDQAVRDYDRAIDLKPDARTYFSRAIAHADSNNQALSLKDQESAKQLGAATVIEVAKKEHTVAYYIRARDSAARGENERAISDFTRAITLAPSFIAAFEGRALAYIALGKAELGIQDLTAVATAMPKDPSIYVSRGNAYLKIPDYEKAIMDFTMALDLDPDLVEPRFKRAFAHAKLRSYSEAIDDYKIVIDLQPTYIEAYFECGKAYLNRGDLRRDNSDYHEAVVHLRRAAEERTDNAAPLYLSGLANARRGNFGEACTDFANAIERDPSLGSRKNIDYSGAFFDRGRVAKSEFDNPPNSALCKAAYNRAVEDFNKAIALHPTGYPAAVAKINEMQENYNARCGY
jgi:tetratricopeptide (TPR) repeat protein